MPRKIAMVGTAGSGRKGPFNDKSFEIWGVSARADYVTRADRWFELHRLDGEDQSWADKWRRTMRVFTEDIPEVLMLWPEPDLAPPGVIKQYPVDRIVERFGSFFMTSTFSWMMALGIDEMCPIGQMAEPGSEIFICGVDMEYGTEYREQRAGLRHFMFLAKALGIEVTRLADGGLAYEPVPYPMWQDDPLLCKLKFRSAETRANLDNFDRSIRLTREMIANTRGGLEEIDIMLRSTLPAVDAEEDTKVVPYDPAKRQAELEKRLNDLIDTSAETSKSIVKYEATLEEQSWLKDYLMP